MGGQMESTARLSIVKTNFTEGLWKAIEKACESS
jgi:hypothetical protein